MSEEEPAEGTIEDREEKQDGQTYDYQQGYGYPEPTVKENIFKFFREILNLEDSTKVSFLEGADLHNVRLYQDTAVYLEIEGASLVADYFNDLAENTLATAMSKKGFFLNTTVTQVRKVQRLSSGSEGKKTGLFGLPKKQQPQEGEVQ